MDGFKKYSTTSFCVITIFSLFFSAYLNIFIYHGFNWLKVNKFFGNGHEDELQQYISVLMDSLQLLYDNIYIWVMPGIVFLFLIFGWLLWALLKTVAKKNFMADQDSSMNYQKKNESKKDFLAQKIERDRKRRLFLHSLVALQRDARLLDFFDEDLSLYDDEQIGAAVRSVQEDSKKTIKKYINLKPVVDKEEGDIVKIEPGFDIDSMKLVGNVAGDPPFEGVLKHRGWRAGKKELPKLSDIQDSTIITPAEIEIE